MRSHAPGPGVRLQVTNADNMLTGEQGAGSIAGIHRRDLLLPSAALHGILQQPPSRSQGHRPTAEPLVEGRAQVRRQCRARCLGSAPRSSWGSRGSSGAGADLRSSRGASHTLKRPADVGPDQLAQQPVTSSHGTIQTPAPLILSLFKVP